MLQNSDSFLSPIIEGLNSLKKNVQKCDCGNLDEQYPCHICSDQTREKSMCVVSDVTSLWAIEKSGCFRGLYHVLDKILSPIGGGISPEELGLDKLQEKAERLKIEEIILALNPTAEGRSTADHIRKTVCSRVKCSELGLGIPMGAELDYLDRHTIAAGLRSRI